MDRFPVPFLQNAQGKRGTAEKAETPVFPASAGTGWKGTAPFFKSQAGMEPEMEPRRIQQNQGSRDIFYIFTVYFYTLVPLFIYFIKYICE